MNTEISPIDYDDLKRRISEEIGKVLHELAAKKGMSYDEFREYFFAKLRGNSRSNAKRTRRAKAAARFDQKIERDAKAGKLDAPADRAIDDFRKGRAREL